jgi:hypothetical protein
MYQRLSNNVSALACESHMVHDEATAAVKRRNNVQSFGSLWSGLCEIAQLMNVCMP